ncbi:SM-ATX domain-containing protein [Abeliophyllum distichum]|uniref:SM-ATX domain-containing protein n=1 Tax=Abeliophyllum distichum TaxID=126358 RepID=A0ABD1RC86_9LAMI
MPTTNQLQDIPEFLDKKTTHEVQGSSLSMGACETQLTDVGSILDETNMQRTPKGVSSGCPAPLHYEMQQRPNLEEIPCSEARASDVSIYSCHTHLWMLLQNHFSVHH